MKLTRRDFIKTNAIAAAATAGGIAVPGLAQAAAPGKDDGVRWDKGACQIRRASCRERV